MTTFKLGDYGSNPNAGRSPSPKAWGGYQWPAGVPAALMATARHPDRSDAYFPTRVELVPLWEELMHFAHLQGYRIYGMNGSVFWGPWGYQNRAISGTSSPSNHSAAIAADINAPNNPQSYTFSSDIPPVVVNAFETCGFYWGGRYTGGTKYDTMHFEYCFAPSDVATHLTRARSLTGAVAPVPPDTKEVRTMALIITASDEPRPHLLLQGDDGVQLADGASSEALRDAGVPFAAIKAVDWDTIREHYEVDALRVRQ